MEQVKAKEEKKMTLNGVIRGIPPDMGLKKKSEKKFRKQKRKKKNYYNNL